jgi:hypothetical protein
MILSLHRAVTYQAEALPAKRNHSVSLSLRAQESKLAQPSVVNVDVVWNSVLVTFGDGKVVLLESKQIYDSAETEEHFLVRVTGGDASPSAADRDHLASRVLV